MLRLGIAHCLVSSASFNLCRGYLGTGSVDLTGLFRGLAAIGYRGPITFESFSSEVRSMIMLAHTCTVQHGWYC